MTSTLRPDACLVCGRRLRAHYNTRNAFLGCRYASRREQPLQAAQPPAQECPPNLEIVKRHGQVTREAGVR